MKLFLALAAIACVSTSAASQDKWEAAAAAAVRLPASSFPELPDRLQVQLLDRGCTIPQVYEMSPPHNVAAHALSPKPPKRTPPAE